MMSAEAEGIISTDRHVDDCAKARIRARETATLSYPFLVHRRLLDVLAHHFGELGRAAPSSGPVEEADLPSTPPTCGHDLRLGVQSRSRGCPWFSSAVVDCMTRGFANDDYRLGCGMAGEETRGLRVAACLEMRLSNALSGGRERQRQLCCSLAAFGAVSCSRARAARCISRRARLCSAAASPERETWCRRRSTSSGRVLGG